MALVGGAHLHVIQPLAIVGASARAAAASAVRAGFQPVTADLFADLDLRSIATATRISPYPAGLVDWLRTIDPPAWMYTGALENHPELVDQMAWIAPLWGNPGDVLARVRSPWELADALRDAGLLFPETRSSAAGLPQDGSWLVKTYRGASGSGVRSFPLADRETPGEASEFVYQQRIPGQSCSATFVAAAGAATLLGITRQLVGEPWLGAHGFQYAGSIGPLQVTDAVQSTLRHIGHTIAERFELIGLFGVDFLLADEQVWTVEVNPRYTASVEIIERMTGIHALAAHAAACRGQPIDRFDKSEMRNPKSEISFFHGKAILFARQDVTIPVRFATMSLAEAFRQPWPTLADISADGTLIEAGRPILTVFADGRSAEDVESRLRERVATLEDQLYADL